MSQIILHFHSKIKNELTKQIARVKNLIPNAEQIFKKEEKMKYAVLWIDRAVKQKFEDLCKEYDRNFTEVSKGLYKRFKCSSLKKVSKKFAKGTLDNHKLIGHACIYTVDEDGKISESPITKID